MTKIIRNDSLKTKNENIEQAIGKIAADVYEILAPEPEHRSIIGQSLQLIATNGCPVTPKEIAIRVSVSPDEVTSTLRKFGAEFNQKGNILWNWTISDSNSTCRKLYVWCAVDALALPVILKQTARIESPDLVTGKEIQISVTPDRIEKIEPKSADASLIKSIDVTNVQSNFCNNVNFFSSPETAAKWIAERPDMIFYPVDGIYQAFKFIHLNKYHDIITQSNKQERRMCC